MTWTDWIIFICVPVGGLSIGAQALLLEDSDRDGDSDSDSDSDRDSDSDSTVTVPWQYSDSTVIVQR